MADSVKVVLGDVQVGMTDEDLIKDATPAKLEENTYYRFEVVGSPESELNLENGNMRVIVPVQPVDDEGKGYKPTLRWYINMPWDTPASILEQAGLPSDFQEKRPSPFFTRLYARATAGLGRFPNSPRKNKDTGEIEFDGGVLTDWDEATTEKIRVNKEIDALFQDLYRDPNGFVGDKFYAQVDTNDKGYQGLLIDFNDFDTMPVAELPEGATIGTLPV